jgi:hypothetical protein
MTLQTYQRIASLVAGVVFTAGFVLLGMAAVDQNGYLALAATITFVCGGLLASLP